MGKTIATDGGSTGRLPERAPPTPRWDSERRLGPWGRRSEAGATHPAQSPEHSRPHLHGVRLSSLPSPAVRLSHARRASACVLSGTSFSGHTGLTGA